MLMEFAKSSLVSEDGFSLMEALVAVTIAALLTFVAVSNIKTLDNPLADASFQVSQFIRLARAQAIAKTLAIQIGPVSSTQLASSSSESCDGTMTSFPELALTLPEGASFSDTSWTVCFTQRGLSDVNLIFDLQNQEGQTREVEVALGGGVEIR